MTKYGNLFDAIGSFDMSLGKWQNDLGGVPSERYAKAAQIHVQRSRDWIRPLLETPEYTRTIRDDAVIKYLKNAVIVIANPKRRATTGVLSTCAAIDEALKSTYEVVQRHAGKKDRVNPSFSINEPITYDKTLSFLPGDDPDFPTDDSSSDKQGTSGTAT